MLMADYSRSPGKPKHLSDGKLSLFCAPGLAMLVATVLRSGRTPSYPGTGEAGRRIRATLSHQWPRLMSAPARTKWAGRCGGNAVRASDQCRSGSCRGQYRQYGFEVVGESAPPFDRMSVRCASGKFQALSQRSRLVVDETGWRTRHQAGGGGTESQPSQTQYVWRACIPPGGCNSSTPARES
jgi:hypothetical protein